MGLHGMLRKLTLKGVIIAAIAAIATAQVIPGCPESCGNLSIPYPFGMREGCYLNESFLITCNDSKPYLRKGDLDVLNISLEGQLRILSPVAYDCYDELGIPTSNSDQGISLSKFPVSSTRNKFTAVGCDTYAIIEGVDGRRYTTGCMSLCDRISDLLNGSCSGIGCCQTSIPKGVQDFSMSVYSYSNHTGIWDFNKCSYAFVVEEDHYNFSSVDLNNLQNVDQFPVVLDWAVGDAPCEQARKNMTAYLCQENSVCYDSDNGPGYRCNCSEGYQGNPYFQNGCKDTNECNSTSLNECTHICNNTPGNYTCLCPKGYHGDGRKSGIGCFQNEKQSSRIKETAGISIGLVAIFSIISFIYWGIRRREIIKLKENFFKQNGGIMLQQLLSNSKSKGSVQRAKIFTEEELKKATNNFNERNVVGEGGYGTVYKGTLPNDMIVAIKKSKVVDHGQIEQFVNEVIILSQIKHPNVVKLLGCCLETPVPLLVYEFITNNTLSHHIHDDGRVLSMPWEMRLRIATETAGALAHMHSAPMHIIHRDVKSANILLDDEYTAKVSDFGVSRLIPLDQTQLPTLVQGTFGYIDPEYFHSGLLTKKSDVYSFGVILLELLTGQKVVSLDRPEKDRNLATYFISSLEDDRLHQVLEDRVKKEGHAEQLKRVAEVAKKCLRLKGDKRPTMKEVKEEFEALRHFHMHSWLEIRPELEEKEPML
ncbi:hypothetical protein F0562_002783 [Nyssa sinensis]|uniref:Protein kinase domain-containing protein n=1 Tax=Nyssa sinensis TaxID=561372 RepID=A0A5J5BUL4_9ASTE|nr:hypothetical protein F0562_002783 [Nyssa sinensis]